MTVARNIAGFAVAASLLGTSSAVAAASTSAHTRIVSGSAYHVGGSPYACATSGPDPAVRARFGTGVDLPTEGYAYCNLKGADMDSSSATGISQSQQSLASVESDGVHTQIESAVADFGVLKSSSDGSYTGSNGYPSRAGEAAAVSTDTLTAPTGVAYFQFGITVDGSATGSTYSGTETILNYQVNSGPIYTVFSAAAGGGQAYVSGNPGHVGDPLAGFTTTVAGGNPSVSGSGTFYGFDEAVTPGAAFDLTLGLYTASYPGVYGVADSDFADTARLSSILAFDASGRPIDFGTIIGASGRLYDADGVHTAVGGVPEPASWAMMMAGFGLIGAMRRRVFRRTA